MAARAARLVPVPGGGYEAHGNLPLRTSEIVPRDREQREIVTALLSPDCRLLSLVGAPGTGKTRLALMAAEELDAAFERGAVFVDLAPLQDAEAVGPAIAASLGIRDMGDRPPVESLKVVLRDQELLLVLDNFEHLLAAAPLLTELLETCPGLHVLATSRSRLHLSPEHVYTVNPLNVPRADQVGDLERLAAVPAVALFCLRARAANQQWRLDNANAYAVSEVCRRLDGLPLAIELAAAWMGVLSPRALLPRLEECLEVPAAGQDQPARHQTLRAAVGWSYALLAPDERMLFDRLAVFNGGWTLEAAAAVGNVPPKQALALLAALADKHLVLSVERLDGEPRFSMLATIGAFAAAQLREANGVDAARRSHANYFLELSERAERELVGPDQPAWLDRLEDDFENLRGALRWAELEDSELALRVAGALWFFWDMRGHLREGRAVLDRVLGVPGAERTSVGRIAALNAAGWLALVQGDYGASSTFHEQAVSDARVLGDQQRLGRSLILLCLARALGSPDHQRTLALYAEGLALARDWADTWSIGIGLYGKGHVHALRGELDQMNTCWHECLAVSQRVMNLYALGYLEFRWGLLGLVTGNPESGEQHLVEGLAIAARLDNVRTMAFAMDALACAAVSRRDLPRAARLFGAAQSLMDFAGYSLHPSLQAEHERALAATRAALADEVFTKQWEFGRQLPRGQMVPLARGELELEKGGDGPARAGRAVPGLLTPREWDVVQLLTEGLTNRQIAERLTVTERTVGAHLEHVFAKLHVQTRAQVAVWVAEHQSGMDSGRLVGLDEQPPGRALRVVRNQ